MKKDKVLLCKMYSIVLMYIEKPNDPYFQRFTERGLEGIKLLASAIKEKEQKSKDNKLETENSNK